MASIHLQAVVSDDGTLIVRGLPDLAGHKVDVHVQDSSKQDTGEARYPLRGKPVQYIAPFDGVAAEDWDAAQ